MVAVISVVTTAASASSPRNPLTGRMFSVLVSTFFDAIFLVISIFLSFVVNINQDLSDTH
jgi:hypothetical protein